MKTEKQYNEMIRDAAIKVARALAVFYNEPEHIRQGAIQATMQRVDRLLFGDKVVIEGEGLVTDFKNPVEPPAEQINTPETNLGEGSETL